MAAPGSSTLRISVEGEARAEVAKLVRCHLVRNDNDFRAANDGADYPVKRLYQIGMAALPVLAESLHDSRATGIVQKFWARSAPRGESGQQTKVWHVNELARAMMEGIAQHKFDTELPSEMQPMQGYKGSLPDPWESCRRLFLAWYPANKDRTLEERQIADLSDGYFRNRLNAVEWLGRNRTQAARPAIVRYVERNLAARDDSMVETELAESAYALGQIGNRESLPVVRTVIERRMEQLKHHGVQTSMDLFSLFEAYEGRILLGDRTTALAELNDVYEKRSIQMNDYDWREYKRRLEKATLEPKGEALKRFY